MAERQYDVGDRILRPSEIKQARLDLNLSRRVMAELLLLSPGRGHERIKRWEDGDETISAQSSQCIRLWLAVHGLGPVPPVPFKVGRPERKAEDLDTSGDFDPAAVDELRRRLVIRYAAMTSADNLRDVLGMDDETEERLDEIRAEVELRRANHGRLP